MFMWLILKRFGLCQRIFHFTLYAIQFNLIIVEIENAIKVDST